MNMKIVHIVVGVVCVSIFSVIFVSTRNYGEDRDFVDAVRLCDCKEPNGRYELERINSYNLYNLRCVGIFIGFLGVGALLTQNMQ